MAVDSTFGLIVLGLLALVGGFLLTLWWRKRSEISHQTSSARHAELRRDRTPLSDHALEAKVRTLLAQRQAIAAIKLVREQTGWGLTEAKDYVDRLK